MQLMTNISETTAKFTWAESQKQHQKVKYWRNTNLETTPVHELINLVVDLVDQETLQAAHNTMVAPSKSSDDFQATVDSFEVAT